MNSLSQYPLQDEDLGLFLYNDCSNFQWADMPNTEYFNMDPFHNFTYTEGVSAHPSAFDTSGVTIPPYNANSSVGGIISHVPESNSSEPCIETSQISYGYQQETVRSNTTVTLVRRPKGKSKWEPHKEMIKELYIGKKKTLKEVIKIMKDERNFNASDIEYQRQLKRWGFRKNTPEDHWKFIKKRLEEHTRRGYESAVYIGGTHIPPEIVQKRTSRCFMSTQELFKEANRRPRTPKEVAVIPKLYLAYIKTHWLPWQLFCSQMATYVKQDMFVNIPTRMREKIIPCLRLRDYSNNAYHLTMKTVIYRLSSVMPLSQNKIMRKLHVICGLESTEPTWDFLNLIIYLISNNLIDEDPFSKEPSILEVVSNGMLEFFNLAKNYLFLKAILAKMSPTIEAFAEVILKSAIKKEDILITRTILESGISPDLYMIGTRHNVNCRTLLQSASACGNYELVKILLAAKADINLGSGDCGSALECAIRQKHNDIAKLLLDHGADVDYIPGEYQYTPVQSAALVGNAEMVSYLLQHGADVNRIAGKHNGRTALQCAATNGNRSIIDLLLKEGADINGPPADAPYSHNKAGVTMLVAAVLQHDYELIRFLLSGGADVNDVRGQWTALEAAAECNDAEMVRILLDANANPKLGGPVARAAGKRNFELICTLLEVGANIDGDGSYIDGEYGYTYFDIFRDYGYRLNALQAATLKNDNGMVQLLLGLGADPCKALELASACGDMDVIQMLIEAGVQHASIGSGPLRAAASNGRLKALKYYASLGVDMNLRVAEQGHVTSVLQAAVSEGHVEVVQFLLSKGADVNAPAPSTSGGMTALQVAAHEGNLALVELLLEAGADANALPACDGGYTALQAAAMRGNNTIVRRLLACGANVNSPAAAVRGRTALQAASLLGHFETTELLLLHGADVNAPAALRGGFTALQSAAWGGYLRIAESLLKVGADVNVPLAFERGMTALEAAASNGHLDMVKLLLVAGATISGDGRAQFETAIYLATTNGYHATARFLRYHQIRHE